MNFTFSMGGWNTVFAVPSLLVDRHLKLAGKEQLQVILWLLRHAGTPCSAPLISQELAISLDDAEDAVQYWIDCGLLCQQNTALLPVSETAETTTSVVSTTPLKEVPPVPQAKPAESPTPTQLQKKKNPHPKPDGMYLATRLTESPNLQFLMQESENALGKTLSPALSSALLMFYEDYGLPVEVILMMIHYACNAGKTGTSYIEALATDWTESEIFTIEAAEQKLKDLDEHQQAWRRLETIMGLHHRAPSKREASYSYTWIKEWNTQNELITEAYERCVDKTGKLSLAYINKILEKWHNTGISTPDDLVNMETKKEKFSQKNKSYDLDQLEALSYFNPVEE